MILSRDDYSQLQLSGLCVAESGKLDRLFSGDHWQVPSSIEIQGESLIWQHSDKNPTVVHPAPGLIEDFVRLHEATPNLILKYAKQWGPLGICEHNLPASHSFPTHFVEGEDVFRCCLPREWDKKVGYYIEPLHVWRQFSREAYAILWIASRLHSGKLGRTEDWQTVFLFFGSPAPHHSYIPSATIEQKRVAYLVQRWLGLGGIRPRFSWDGAAPTFQLGGPTPEGLGLFPALAFQLMLIISRVDGIIICAGCGSPAVPTRRPRLNENSYCQSCREKGVPAKFAMRRQREGESKPRKVKRRRKRNRSTKKAR